ncbi:response regulator [Cohnella sp. WQ 127256]|uniref:response regulator n=1 Tax=Cohnella sp. WQ 127256 TaxID=2938790 RepID=UPI0021179ACE|nr:response regulator [Cohnella sp. WQ 127256]
MYRVLLVEDEILVRLGLKNSIDWNRFRMQVIADVANGAEAWDAYKKMQPDVVITDLKMPVMGGLELIAKIRSVNPHTQLVILTCLEEFELARKAMSLGVRDYIVKHSVSTEELETVLSKLENELARTAEKTPAGTIVSEADIGILKENLLKGYLFLNRYSPEEFGRKAEEVNLTLSPRQIIVCAMEIDAFDRLREKFKDDKGQLVRSSLLNVLNEVIKLYGLSEVFHDHDNRYVILFSYPGSDGEKEIEESLYRMLGHIRRVMTTYFNVVVSFGISSRENGFPHLRRQYRESVEALGPAFAKGTGKNYVWGRKGDDELSPETKSRILALADLWEPASVKYRSGFAERLNEFLDRKLFRARTEALRAFMQWLHDPVLSLRLTGEEMTVLCSAYAERLVQAGTLDAMICLYQDYVREIIGLLAARKRTSSSVTLALRYIESHFADDLSLQQVADVVSMNANYFSTLFKKEMKLNFIDYLLQYRVERARELFLNSNLKSYEIGERVGFANTSHFSRVFKKVLGVSPREYRKQWDEGASEDDQHEMG